MACRTYTSAAWLHVTASGRAFTKLQDGRSAVVTTSGSGWVHILAGTISDTFTSAEAATDDLISHLANEKVLLRRC